MAKRTDDGPHNPDVKFERVDIEPSKVINFGLILAGVLIVTGILTLWLARLVTQSEAREKTVMLPEAAVDRDTGFTLPPEPRLEAIDDLRDTSKTLIELFPPRASAYLKPQRDELAKGVTKDGIEPISTAMEQLAGKLPARKQAAPNSFGVALPSAASAGRTTTGGR